MLEDHDSEDGGDQRENAESEPPEPRSGSEILVTIHPEPGLDLEAALPGWLTDRLREAAAAADASGIEAPLRRVSVRILGDRAMTEAHRRWRDIDGTTDVLTFHSFEDDGLHVDLMICHDEAGRRASDFGHETRHELLLYAVHGLLHCLGHDDHDPEAFERMHREEDRLLHEIGIGPVFRPGGIS